jgi:hypothetical protein
MPKVPVRYLPSSLSRKDRKIQIQQLRKSRKLYAKNQYYTRKPASSFVRKTSKHVLRARKIYDVSTVTPNRELSLKTGCSVEALNQIVKKGEGAYFSSGSRPNQTAQSWGLARLASAITYGKSAAVDYNILEEGCDHRGKAFRYAVAARKKHGQGKRHTQRVMI